MCTIVDMEVLDAFAECAVTGALSSSQLRELEKCDRPKYRSLLSELQEDLAADVTDLDAAQTQLACDLWRQRADAIVAEDEPVEEPRRTLNTAVAGDGHLLGRFSLDPAGRLEFETAIGNALTWNGKEETRSAEERRGDALFDIMAFFNLNHAGNGTPRHHPHVSMSMDISTLDAPSAVNDQTGELIDTGCAGTKLCDCIIHTILRGPDGTPLAYGRATYSVPRHLFRQVAARDGGCRFPGCNRPVKFTEAHHIHWWERHGLTDYANLTLLCGRHHHLVHRDGPATRMGQRLGPEDHLARRHPTPRRTTTTNTPTPRRLTSPPPQRTPATPNPRGGSSAPVPLSSDLARPSRRSQRRISHACVLPLRRTLHQRRLQFQRRSRGQSGFPWRPQWPNRGRVPHPVPQQCPAPCSTSCSGLALPARA
jgi:hypothetical protein